MWLHEVRPDTKEADELARRIMTSLAKAWAWDHGIEAEVIVRRQDQQTAEGEGGGKAALYSLRRTVKAGP